MMDPGNRGARRLLEVTTWNTQGTKSKSLELEEAIGLIRPDVLLLQETLEKGELWVRGYRTLYEPAEDGAGKQGVGVAIHRDLEASKIGSPSPHFCLCEVKGLFGKLTVGSVYMPCGEQTTTMESLERVMRKLVAKEGSVLLGGDWNMSKEDVKKEARKWLLDTRIVDTSCWPRSLGCRTCEGSSVELKRRS